MIAGAFIKKCNMLTENILHSRTPELPGTSKLPGTPELSRIPEVSEFPEVPSFISRISEFVRGRAALVVLLAIVAGCAPGRFSGFESRVLKSDKTYLVEVTSDFCPMCRVSEDEVAAFEGMEEHKGKGGVRVFRVRLEKCDRELRQWLGDHGFYNDVPFYVIVENGKVVGDRTGAFFTLKEVEKFMKGAGKSAK